MRSHVRVGSSGSDVIEHGLPMVCGHYYTTQTIKHHKNVIHALIFDYSYQDGWLLQII